MALASLADVKTVLRITGEDDTRDAQLQNSLDAVESWAERRLWHISLSGSQVETYFDVFEDATIRLPSEDVVVTVVRVFEYPSSSGVPLSPISLGLGHGYDVTDDGNLLLRPTLGVSPFEGAMAQRRLRIYARVEVHYEGTGIVPKAVTEGIAFLAAGHWKDGPRALQGLTSERIGDYSYTLGDVGKDGTVPAFESRAMFFLKPYLKRQRVAMT